MICYILLLLAPSAVLGSKDYMIETADGPPQESQYNTHDAFSDGPPVSLDGCMRRLSDCCACAIPDEDSDDSRSDDSRSDDSHSDGEIGDTQGGVPAASPAPAAKITPKFHYIHWV